MNDRSDPTRDKRTESKPEVRPPADGGPTPAGSRLASRLGDYELRREVGRGGMGTVYEAWQVSLQRVVALKLLASHVSSSQKAVLRFQREAQAAAKLHHTHIVPIFAQGEVDGQYFYAMEFVDGESLNAIISAYRRDEHLEPASDVAETVVLPRSETATAGSGSSSRSADAPTTTNLPPIQRTPYGTPAFFGECAEHIAAVADALAYAHQMGVVHRDIKPHNLILGSDGRLRISDFGLARLTEQPGVTMTGELVGSPLYMSPEQISGDPSRVDHRADIYSLGATLYEWLTLRPPYPGETREQVISRILGSEAPPVRSHNPEIPVDLETIVLKSIERDPARRYASAAELRDDLRRFVARQPIVARRAGVGQRTVKFVRRHQVAVLASVFMIVAGALTWTVRVVQRRAESDRAAAIGAAAAAEEAAETNELLTGFIGLLQANPVTIAEAALPMVEDMVGRRPPSSPTTSPGSGVSAPSVGTPASIALAVGRAMYAERAAVADAESPASPEAGTFAEALQLWRKGRWQEARATLEPELAEHHEDFHWYELYAAVCMQLRRYEDVLAATEPFLQTPHAARATVWRALAGLLTNRLEQTAMELGRASLDANLMGWVRVVRGLLWIQTNNLAEALRDLDAVVEDAPDLAAARLARAHALLRADRVDEALAEASRVLEADPQSADALTIRGDCYLQRSEFAAAERDYREAMEIVGKTPVLMAKWGTVYLQRSQGNLESADSLPSSGVLPRGAPPVSPPRPSDRPADGVDPTPTEGRPMRVDRSWIPGWLFGGS